MSTVTETIPTFVDIPTTADPTNFDAEADDFLGTQLPAFVASANTWAGQINTVSGEVNVNAISVAANTLAAQAAALTAVGASNYVGAYSTLTGAKTAGIACDYLGAFWLLLENTADVTADVPGVSGKWGRLYGAGQIYQRTSNIEFVAEDSGKIIEYTSGTFSQAFDACANLGPNWFVYTMNPGSGVVTYNPDGSELINGASTKVHNKDTVTMILCDGSALTTIEFSKPLSDSHVTVTTGNGHGATNTAIRRYTTTESSVGTAITYADSGTNGATFTINEAGLYDIYMVDQYAAGAAVFGVSVNSTQLTTSINSITAATRILYTSGIATAETRAVSRVVRLAIGDVVRPHTDMQPNATTALNCVFSVRKVGL